MDWAVVFAGVPTGITAAVEDLLPIAVPVFVLLASIGIAFAIFRKVGIKR